MIFGPAARTSSIVLAAALAGVMAAGCSSATAVRQTQGGAHGDRAAGTSMSMGMSMSAPMPGVPPLPVPLASGRVGDLVVSGGYLPEPASPDVAAAYLTVANSGPESDTLTRVTAPLASSVMAMTETDRDGVGVMTDLSPVIVPGHGSFRFSPGRAHLMLQHPDRVLREGQRVTVTLTFAHAGALTLELPVVGLTGPSTMPQVSAPQMSAPHMSMSPG